MIRSGRLEDDAGRIRSDPGDQSLVALLGVWEPAAFAIRETISVQRLFRDVDANGNLGHLFRASACHSGRNARVSVQAKGKDEGGQTLARPVNGQRILDPSLAADERGASLSQRTFLA